MLKIRNFSVLIFFSCVCDVQSFDGNRRQVGDLKWTEIDKNWYQMYLKEGLPAVHYWANLNSAYLHPNAIITYRNTLLYC